MLHTVRELDIGVCSNIKSISGLKNLVALTMTPRRLENEFTADREIFQQLDHLELTFFPYKELLPGTYLIDWVLWERSRDLLSLAENLRSFSLVACDCFLVFPAIPNGLRSLRIKNCHNFESLPPLPPSLGCLEISQCETLFDLQISEEDGGRSLSGKYPLSELTINDCPELWRIHIRRNVSRGRISSCNNLSILEVGQQIAHLKVVDTKSLTVITNFSKIRSLTGDYSKENSFVNELLDELIIRGEEDR
jgi:hypothetical protein